MLDDPVTSLDIEWREVIAKMIVDETLKKQVIIFTHDMPFLYYLKQAIDESEKESLYHWILREEGSEIEVGRVALNSSPVNDKEFTNVGVPEKFYKEAIDEINPLKKQAILWNGFSVLRRCYEVITIEDLLNGVVQRFSDYVRMGNLRELCLDPEIISELFDGHGRISRYIPAHSQSDEFSGKPLDTKTLRAEIDKLIQLKKRIKDHKAANKKNK